MKRIRLVLACAGALAVAGCAAPPAATGPVPATLTVLAPACLEQLAQFSSQATGRKVSLGAQNSFLDTDQLVLEQASPRGPDGLPLDGRRVGAPTAEVFRLLVTPGGTCTVLHERTGLQAPLAACSCRPKQ